MNGLLLVMAGGAIGAGARFLAAGAVGRALGNGWPWGTLTVNVIGGLLMGLLVARVSDGGDPLRLILGVGVLGGFTTFSAFSLEVVELIERGVWPVALAYAVVSVVLCVCAVFAGLAVAR